MKKNDSKLIKKMISADDSPWHKEVAILLEEYNVTQEDMSRSKEILSRKITDKNEQKFNETITKEAEVKTKVKHWHNMIQARKISKRPAYIWKY